MNDDTGHAAVVLKAPAVLLTCPRAAIANYRLRKMTAAALCSMRSP